jgi:hypothetical protein
MEKVVFSKNDQVIQQNNHFFKGHYKMGNTTLEISTVLKEPKKV